MGTKTEVSSFVFMICEQKFLSSQFQIKLFTTFRLFYFHSCKDCFVFTLLVKILHVQKTFRPNSNMSEHLVTSKEHIFSNSFLSRIGKLDLQSKGKLFMQEPTKRTQKHCQAYAMMLRLWIMKKRYEIMQAYSQETDIM